VSIATRLDRLTPVLTARERAILVLGAWKDRTPEDPAWRSTMPPSQVPEFNRLVALMNVANGTLAAFITVIEKAVGQAKLRLCWLVDLHLWAEHLDEIRCAVASEAKRRGTKPPRAVLRAIDSTPFDALGTKGIGVAGLLEALRHSTSTVAGEC
jgi:hypothetical protein